MIPYGLAYPATATVMLICHCHRINDRTILRHAAEGARTVAEIARRCGAGRSCGGCVSAVGALLKSARRPLPVLSEVLRPEAGGTEAGLAVPLFPEPQLATG